MEQNEKQDTEGLRNGLNDKLKRLATFKDWKHMNDYPPSRLADSGLYCSGNDILKCYKCGQSIVLGALGEPGPSILHDCDMHSEKDVRMKSRTKKSKEGLHREELENNRSKTGESQHKTRTQHKRKKFVGNIIHVTNESETRKIMREKRLSPSWGIEPKAVSMYEYRSHATDKYKDRDERINSYMTWQGEGPVGVDELVDAGWFYTGVADKVQCPWCYGAVYNWEEGDTGLGEHDKYFPDCPFVKDKLYRVFSPVKEAKFEFPSNKENQGATSESFLKESLLDLGYSETAINNASQNLEKPGSDLNMDTLLDEIWRLEKENPNFAEESGAGNMDNKIQRNPISGEEDHKKEENASNIKHVDSTADFSINDFEKANEALKSKVVCKVCLDAPVERLFLPCRHIVCCERCSNKLGTCPLCRKGIDSTIKLSTEL